jgi:hypothetical protein
MTKIYRYLFLYIPLVTAALFIALMAIPRSVFIPWEHLNIWTVLKAFALSYILLGFVSVAMKRPQIGRHLILAGLMLGVISVGLCWLTFKNLYYLANFTHLPAFLSVFSAVLVAGYLVMSSQVER